MESRACPALKSYQEYLKGKEEWTWKETKLLEAHELAAVLEDGYEKFVGEWDVSGTIKLVQDRRRKDYGKPEIATHAYQCGY